MGIFAKYAPAYAKAGLPVFPLVEGGKTPRIAYHHGGRGCLDATTDPVRIGIWARAYPNDNIGMRTGHESGIAVVDFDKHHGGFETARELAANGFKFPVTKMASTPKGGRHAFFKHNSRVRNTQGKLSSTGEVKGIGVGIDTRGTNGYVVLAPSVVDYHDADGVVTFSGSYSWLSGKDTLLAELPRWALELIDPPREKPKHVVLPKDKGDDFDRVRKALRYISADDRDNLIAVGMAIAGRFGDAGRDLFDAWAMQSQKFSDRHQSRIWRSFRNSGRTIGTIFYLRSLSRGSAPLYQL